MLCAKCGFDNPAEAKFCGRCGETMRAPVPQPPPPGGEAVSQGLKVGIIIGSVFIPLLGIIMGAIYMNDPNPEKKKVGRLWLYVGIGVFALECICFFVFGMIGSMNPNAFK
jgi:hypothetical protein